jgi:phospholipid-binding lipoprotein MlaA
MSKYLALFRFILMLLIGVASFSHSVFSSELSHLAPDANAVIAVVPKSAEKEQESLEAQDQQAQDQQAQQTFNVAVYADPRDPFEAFNRSMWDFNYNYLDRYLLRPIVVGYDTVMPDVAQEGLYNALKNLDEPVSVWTNLLQGKFMWSLNAAGRFVINSTVGLLGIYDVAYYMGLERKQDTLSEVFGYYGVPDGPYAMLPVFGPKVMREVVVQGTEYALRYFVPEFNALYFPMNNVNVWHGLAKWSLESIHERKLLFVTEGLIENAIDPYLFVKEAYLKNVAYRVYDGNPPVIEDSEPDDDFLDDYLDELD